MTSEYDRLPRVTREEALSEYAKASEQLLPESQRRGIYPPAGCHRHNDRGEAETDVHRVVDQKADTETNPSISPAPMAMNAAPALPLSSGALGAAIGFMLAAVLANYLRTHYGHTPLMGWVTAGAAVASLVCAYLSYRWRR